MVNEIEYFWETEYKFGEFLKKIFGEDIYKRKYSLEGNGIFNLLTVDNQVYEVKYSKTTKMLSSDNSKYKDSNKEYIINTIVQNLKPNTEYHINNGKFITFTVGKWIAKIEIIAKRAIPK